MESFWDLIRMAENAADKIERTCTHLDGQSQRTRNPGDVEAYAAATRELRLLVRGLKHASNEAKLSVAALDATVEVATRSERTGRYSKGPFPTGSAAPAPPKADKYTASF